MSGGNPIDGRGYDSAPALPPGWPATLTFVYYAWQQSRSNAEMLAIMQDPNFVNIVSGISVVLRADDILAGAVLQLQFLFANLPLPPGKTYKFLVHMPLSSLSALSYPFATRLMNVRYEQRQSVPMLVPILSAANQPLVTAFVIECLEALQAIFNAAGSAFEWVAFGGAPTAEAPYDAEFTVPSDVSETSAQQSIAVWATYGVTEAGVAAFLATHLQAIQLGPCAGKLVTMPYLNPDLTSVGQFHDAAVSYINSVTGVATAFYDINEVFLVNDQSLAGVNERTEIVHAANYAGGYWCQITGPAAQDQLIPTFEYLLSRCAAVVEIGSAAQQGYGLVLDRLAAAGWRGSEFIPPPPDPAWVPFSNAPFDPIAAIDELAPGIVLQRAFVDGVDAAYFLGGEAPLTQAQVVAVTGPLPPYPTGLPRFPDSNPAPDGWTKYGVPA